MDRLVNDGWMNGLVDEWVGVSSKQSGTNYLRVQGPVSRSFPTAFPEPLLSLSPALVPIHKLQCQACQHNETCWGGVQCQVYGHFQVPVRNSISHVLGKGQTRVMGSASLSLLSDLRLLLHLSISCLPSVK